MMISACVCPGYTGTKCCSCVFLPSFISSGQQCVAGMAGIQEEPALPAAHPALCPSPAAAQLDSIGFSIIKKCIHAVETRGRAASGWACCGAAVGRGALALLPFSWTE